MYVYTHTHIYHERVIKIKALLHRATSLLCCWLAGWCTGKLCCVGWSVFSILFCVCVCGRELFFNPSPHTDHFLILYSVPFSLSLYPCPPCLSLHLSYKSPSVEWNQKITFRQIPGTRRKIFLYSFLNIFFLSILFIYYDDDLSPFF
jgi:hypothetical protein